MLFDHPTASTAERRSSCNIGRTTSDDRAGQRTGADLNTNLVHGLGLYAGAGVGMAATATVLGIGAAHVFSKVGDQDSPLAQTVLIGAALPVAGLAGGFGAFAALAPFGAASGVYGLAKPHGGGQALAFATTSLAVAAGVAGVIAGARALDLLPSDGR